MAVACIRDLPFPITAAKADWLVASNWVGFTPQSEGPDADIKCQSVIAKQFGNGYVLEYIVRNFGRPNPGFETDPLYLSEKAEHSKIAGRLVAVHRLRATARPLKTVVGTSDFERIQNMWSEDSRRRRWSVAFPIVESYEITSRPYANAVFSPDVMQRLFAHPSATLRTLNDNERTQVADLPIAPRATSNAWIAIEDEIEAAEGSEIDPRIAFDIDEDLAAAAMEGLTAEQQRKVRRRVALLAQRFVQRRQRIGTLRCDNCAFDPEDLIVGTSIKPRSLLDVHHLCPLEEGVRVTTEADFKLLCPNCHRFAHALLRAQKTLPTQYDFGSPSTRSAR